MQGFTPTKAAFECWFALRISYVTVASCLTHGKQTVEFDSHASTLQSTGSRINSLFKDLVSEEQGLSQVQNCFVLFTLQHRSSIDSLCCNWNCWHHVVLALANAIAQMSKRNHERTITVSPMVARVVCMWILPCNPEQTIVMWFTVMALIDWLFGKEGEELHVSHSQSFYNLLTFQHFGNFHQIFAHQGACCF